MLLDRNGILLGAWPYENGQGAHVISWEELETKGQVTAESAVEGVEISNTLSACALQPWLPTIKLISILFPNFSDGRGLSLARQIRRNGFNGILRAHGPLIPDEFYYLIQCGFDEVLVTQESALRQTAEQWQQALAHRNGNYQQGYTGQMSILEARRNARSG